MSTAITEPAAASAPSTDLPARSRIGPRKLVASLWLFVILCYIYCDILGLMYPEDLRGYLDGNIGGIEVTQEFLLAAAVLMTIPLASVLISRVASHRFARWESVVAGSIMTVVQVSTLGFGTPPTLHYIYFSIIEATTTAAIVWIAVRRWKVDA